MSTQNAEPGFMAPLEQDLDANDAGVRLLVENVRDYAILLLDLEGHILTWNKGAELLKGYTADEIIGQHFSVFYTAEDLAAGKPARELLRGRSERAVGRRKLARAEGWLAVLGECRVDGLAG